MTSGCGRAACGVHAACVQFARTSGSNRVRLAVVPRAAYMHYAGGLHALRGQFAYGIRFRRVRRGYRTCVAVLLEGRAWCGIPLLGVASRSVGYRCRASLPAAAVLALQVLPPGRQGPVSVFVRYLQSDVTLRARRTRQDCMPPAPCGQVAQAPRARGMTGARTLPAARLRRECGAPAAWMRRACGMPAACTRRAVGVPVRCVYAASVLYALGVRRDCMRRRPRVLCFR